MVKVCNIRKNGQFSLSFDLQSDDGKNISCGIHCLYCHGVIDMQIGQGEYMIHKQLKYPQNEYSLPQRVILFKLIKEKDFTKDMEDYLEHCEIVDEFSKVQNADGYDPMEEYTHLMNMIHGMVRSKPKGFIGWIKSKLGIA